MGARGVNNYFVACAKCTYWCCETLLVGFTCDFEVFVGVVCACLCEDVQHIR